ncbi:MAG: flavodoxin, partial [Ruminococcus sp.]|nr:flavodoxin [Ruminococcus sp.]
MKKTIAILFSVFMLASLTACGNSQNETVTEPVRTSAETQSEIILEDDIDELAAELETNVTEVESGVSETSAETEETASAAAQAATTAVQTTAMSETTADPQVQESKILVAYFSATNTTEGVAKRIADGLNADIYEIIPAEPYTSADLDYGDNNSRSTIEMNDPNSRPAISGSVENMGQYDIIFIGYPIWWGDAPRIVSTFMESYDFSGKTIVPFCTSGGSG